ncbi:MAG: hypothetical protein ACTH5V_02280 [Serratia proteamaculans]
MGIRELWLKAADSLVAEYLHPGSNGEFDAISVLTALEHAADAMYYVDHQVYLFITEQSRQWFYSGMDTPAKFYESWLAQNGA